EDKAFRQNWRSALGAALAQHLWTFPSLGRVNRGRVGRGGPPAFPASRLIPSPSRRSASLRCGPRRRPACRGGGPSPPARGARTARTIASAARERGQTSCRLTLTVRLGTAEPLSAPTIAARARSRAAFACGPQAWRPFPRSEAWALQKRGPAAPFGRGFP